MNASVIVEKAIAVNPSPYPISFDGSTLRFQLALFSMLSLSIVGSMVATWMARELWRGRHDAYPWEPLFAIRVIFFLCAFQAVIRCAPEAAYMITYREGSVELLAGIMATKRWLDGAAIFPGVTWMVLCWIFYTPICSQMILMSRQSPVMPRVAKHKIWQMIAVLSLVFAISALIAIGKR